MPKASVQGPEPPPTRSSQRTGASDLSTRMISIGKKKVVEQTLDFTGEGFGFGLPFESDHEAQFTSFIESEGLTVDFTYFMGTISKKGPFMVVTDIRT